MPRNKTQAQTPATTTPEAATTTTEEQTVSQTPEATKAPAQTPAERKAARIAAEDAARARGEVVRNAAGRPTARRLPCLCGCGQPTHTDEAWFLSGHDAKLRKAVLDHTPERQTIAALPEIVRPFYRLGAPIAGLRLEEGSDRLIDTKAR